MIGFRQSAAFLWAAGLAAGIVAGFATVGFRELIDAFFHVSFGADENTVSSAAANLPAWRVILVPILGGALIGALIYTTRRAGWLPEGRADGVADVIEARAVRSGRISWRCGMSSTLITALSLGAGASAGREGPAVHLGATFASKIAQWLRLPPAAARMLLACGAASAVAASFNAPIAGVLFALEVVLGHYALAVFGPVTLASVAGAVIARSVYGDFPAFSVPRGVDLTPSIIDLPSAFILGLLCGLVAAAFVHAVRIGSENVKRAARRLNAPYECAAPPPVGGAGLGVTGVFFPQVLGVGYEATDAALGGAMSLKLLLTLMVLKILATAVTLACRFGGGVFAPGLYIGAMAGGAFGAALTLAAPDLFAHAGFYAIIGMGAVSGAVLGAPISTTLIVFELTGDYAMTIALLLAVSAATLTMRATFGRSFFHWQLSQRGYDLDEGDHGVILQTIRIRSVMTRAPGGGATIDSDAPHLLADASLGEALARMRDLDAASLPVVATKCDVEIVGYVTRARALEAYNRALIDAHIEEHR